MPRKVDSMEITNRRTNTKRIGITVDEETYLFLIHQSDLFTPIATVARKLLHDAVRNHDEYRDGRFVEEIPVEIREGATT